MSENRPRNYFPKLFMLDEESIDFVQTEAQDRNPEKAGSREQSGVVRDALAFAKAHHAAFVSWVAIRGNLAR